MDRDLPLLAGIRDQSRRDLLALAQLRQYDAGTRVFASGQASAEVFLLLTGLVRCEVQSERGQSFTERLVFAGSLLGEEALFEDAPRVYHAVTATSSAVLCFEVGPLWGLIRQRPQLLTNFLTLYHQRVQELAALRREATFLNMNGRLALLLLRLGEHLGLACDEGVTIDLPLTHHDLAAMLGATRETVSKTLGLFKKDKAIRNGSTRITILDTARLQSWVRE